MAEYDPLDPDADCFRTPAIPTLVGCLHCGEEYDSYLIEWRVSTAVNGKPHGFWCCPTPGCGGAGFGFDILPADPDYRDENGDKMWSSDEDEDEEDFEDYDVDKLPPDPEATKPDNPPRERNDDEELPW